MIQQTALEFNLEENSMQFYRSWSIMQVLEVMIYHSGLCSHDT